MIDTHAVDRPEIDKLIGQLKDELRADYAPPHVKRQAHPKMHGCVQATLHVDDNVPSHLRHGVFAHAGREYRAWVRFSNAFGIQHDLKFESRGMAVKLLDVPGSSWLRPPGAFDGEWETKTQDFVMATHDCFPLPNAHDYDYGDFARAARDGFFPLVWVFLRNGLFRGLVALIRGGSALARNPLAIRYFSQTPYRLGPRVVKVHARPRLTRALRRSLPGAFRFLTKAILVTVLTEMTWFRVVGWLLRLAGFTGTRSEAEVFCDRYIAPRNYLRLALSSALARTDAQFEIMIQCQTDDRTMPVTDATARWSERRSPFERVALLTIPRQVFWPAPGLSPKVQHAATDIMELGENLSFSPWHGLTEHEPLGDINDARGRVYLAISRYRRHENCVKVPKPDADYDRLREILQSGLLEERSSDS
jgi:hypothetical protein